MERSALLLDDLRLRPAIIVNSLLLRHGLLGSDRTEGGVALPDRDAFRRMLSVARRRTSQTQRGVDTRLLGAWLESPTGLPVDEECRCGGQTHVARQESAIVRLSP